MSNFGSTGLASRNDPGCPMESGAGRGLLLERQNYTIEICNNLFKKCVARLRNTKICIFVAEESTCPWKELHSSRGVLRLDPTDLRPIYSLLTIAIRFT